MLRAGNVALLFIVLLLVLGNIAGASDKLAKFDAMTPEEQLKLAKKKCRKKDEYDSCKVGRYTVYSEVGPIKAYRWGLILDNFTDESIDDKIFPSKLNKRGNPPQVFFLRGRDSYQRATRKFGFPVPGFSRAVFYRDGKNAGLFMYYDDDGSGKEDIKLDAKTDAEMQQYTLHEATHQMVYYHIHTNVPVWFNEGLAMNMETYNTSMSFKANLHNNMYVTERANAAYFINKNGRLANFPALYYMSHDTWNNSSDQQVGINYTSAWLACNFLFTCKKGRKFVGKYIQALKSGGADKAAKLLKSKALNAIDDDIQDHLNKVVAPCVKYGRQIRQMLLDGKTDAAEKGITAMKKEFPDSTEMKFYEKWLEISKTDKPREITKELESIIDKDEDFYHPEMHYVLALGYHKSGDRRDAKKYIDRALKDNSANDLAIKLAEKIK